MGTEWLVLCPLNLIFQLSESSCWPLTRSNRVVGRSVSMVSSPAKGVAFSGFIVSVGPSVTTGTGGGLAELWPEPPPQAVIRPDRNRGRRYRMAPTSLGSRDQICHSEDRRYNPGGITITRVLVKRLRDSVLLGTRSTTGRETLCRIMHG